MSPLTSDLTPPPPRLDDDAASLRAALWRYLRVLGADAATADDLAQEAFLVALRRPDFAHDAAGATFIFLRTTARHLWLKSRRRRQSLREVDEADRVWDARCADRGEEYLAALELCVDQLPERSRALLAATYGERRGRAAAGADFGMRPEGIKSALRRLRAFLHDCIERRLGGGA